MDFGWFRKDLVLDRFYSWVSFQKVPPNAKTHPLCLVLGRGQVSIWGKGLIENQGTHQRENWGKTSSNHRKTHEKPKKEQWIIIENQRQLCQHSIAPFFEFSTFNEERKRDNFEKKRYLSLVFRRLNVHKTLSICSEMQFALHMWFRQSYFSFCWFLATLMEEKSPAQENLACLYFSDIPPA